MLVFVSFSATADPVTTLRTGKLNEVQGARASAASILLRDSFRWTPLMVAAGQNPNPEVLEFLIDSGQNLDARSLDGWTALMFAAAFNPNPQIVRTLIAHGAKIDERTPNNWNFLYGASRYLDENIIQAVIPPTETEQPALRFGGFAPRLPEVAPSVPSQQGWSPIFFAARFNPRAEIYQTLVELGADPEVADEGGMTPLDYARQFNPALFRQIGP